MCSKISSDSYIVERGTYSKGIITYKRWTKMKEEQIKQVLAKSMRDIITKEVDDFEQLQEIRLRVGKPLVIIQGGKEHILPDKKSTSRYITKEELRETMEYISNYSLYAYEHEMKQGFITIEGGHRVGMAGKAIIEGNKVKNLKYISSINIRVSHEVIGCADRIMPHITYHKQVVHTLIISPPRCGKTTLLRDIIRQISDGCQWTTGCTVGVVDERSEIAGCYLGVAQNQMGMRTDILDCCPKAEGMIMMIRSMAPQVIAVDEIGTGDDVHAVEYAMHCGCKMLTTVHGYSMEEIRKKPLFEQMVKERRFERYVVLSNRKRVGFVEGIFNGRGELLFQE